MGHSRSATLSQIATDLLNLIEQQQAQETRRRLDHAAKTRFGHDIIGCSEWNETVVVLRILGGLGDMIDKTVSSRYAGRRILRLLYDWNSQIAPHLHLSDARLHEDVLQKLAEPGEILRARLRAAREETTVQS